MTLELEHRHLQLAAPETPRVPNPYTLRQLVATQRAAWWPCKFVGSSLALPEALCPDDVQMHSSIIQPTDGPALLFNPQYKSRIPLTFTLCESEELLLLLLKA